MLKSKTENYETQSDGNIEIIVTSKAEGLSKIVICTGLIVSMLAVALFGNTVLYNLRPSYSRVIRRIYLLKSGKHLELDCQTSIKTIGIEEFDLVGPEGNSYICSLRYNQLIKEGFPIMIQGDYKILSRHSYVYYTDILSSLGQKKFLRIVD